MGKSLKRNDKILKDIPMKVDYSALIKTGCLELFNKLTEYLTEQQIYITEISDEILKQNFRIKVTPLKPVIF